MRISRLAFKGVGPFDDAAFAFPDPTGAGELVLFEGPNGSGKTTVVEAIAALAARLPYEEPPLEKLRDRMGSSAASIEAEVVHGDAAAQLRFDAATGHFAGMGVDRSSVVDLLGASSEGLPWAALSFGGHQPTASLHTVGPRSIDALPLAGALSFGRTVPASVHLGQLLTNLENERTKALTYARERPEEGDRQELDRIAASRHAAIRRFEQVFSDVLNRTVTIQFSIDQQAPRVRFDGAEIPLDLLGEGMRSTISWLSDLLVRLERIRWADSARSPLDQDFWLILDEVDESLHPAMQARILPSLRRLLPNARIYATTHSPFVVASLGEGTVFSIRPDGDHRVRGDVAAHALEPGQSLELVTSEIFGVPSEFIDADTQGKLSDHERDVRALQEQREIDWEAFLGRRDELLRRNDEVRTAISIQELPVRQAIQRRLREREGGAAA